MIPAWCHELRELTERPVGPRTREGRHTVRRQQEKKKKTIFFEHCSISLALDRQPQSFPTHWAQTLFLLLTRHRARGPKPRLFFQLFYPEVSSLPANPSPVISSVIRLTLEREFRCAEVPDSLSEVLGPAQAITAHYYLTQFSPGEWKTHVPQINLRDVL